MGCGTGLVGQKLKAEGFTSAVVVGYDMSEEMLEVAKQKDCYDKLIIGYMDQGSLPEDLKN